MRCILLNILSCCLLHVVIGELPEQLSRFKILASKGIKEYKWDDAVIERVLGIKQEAGTSAEADLQPDEYAEV